MDIINIVDRLETLIETSKPVPMSGNVIIDKKRAMELVDQMRLVVPQEVRAAEEMLSQKDHIINMAQVDARRTKSQAEDDYRERLNTSELVVTAEHRAEGTLKEAEQRASRLLEQSEAAAVSRRTDADAYALRTLKTLEQELSALNGSVRKGIETLASNANVGKNASNGYSRED